MKLVLLSGGSGKRLWPLSNDSRSKQFIRVKHSNENDDQMRFSMLQKVWEQIKKAGLQQSAVIAAGRGQQELLLSQLDHDVPLVLEPERRDTFPAIALACTYLHSVLNTAEDEVIVVMPVDVDVDDDYFAELRALANGLAHAEDNLALMGIQPSYPAEKYGYIIPAPDQGLQQSLLKVQRFIEKPAAPEAEKWIKLGALWNCGVFAFRLSYVLRILKQNGWPTLYEDLIAHYEWLPQNSFDYEVVEKEKQISVKPFAGRWNDLGTWNEWTEQMKEPMYGKGYVSKDCLNTHVINELNIPVVALGITDAVIVASPDGILISDKAASTGLKQVVQTLSMPPMYQEALYGWYTILHLGDAMGEYGSVTKRVHMYAGKQMSDQKHAHRSELWTLIRGEALVCIEDGRRFTARAGDSIQIPPGSKHSIKAITAVDLIVIQIEIRDRNVAF
ncbi:sugar phosphate nucleotidyltransferase [Paenibacillus apiarius]|uniref:Sugar phosphate nucleotidyltransferase n=1 Tax=Paenibacillus apiarius TaxID=46240 RepID=A0ABT4DWB8_9BACL|nr:sugar phosphate nucleotidyltransferase [Paenibacillus apiarius]MCY9513102.1 sugar phosphate nucleotidyltransferase [Paenibacillus apiarius]MCY9521540.1 sugar phosphate nucleotidyltransferase [Paenibacillus apiarius]MCY9551694.1 sugar phosphate nucleotidyltransferase [Paenibacillus apiarius]MCY9560518.1 sugar phosphate nucleotidyltransferase [Paenibacillus apiarius]MCY9685232.1 sugar phosphate nucleotidyltransferase [Paenibacillus apiarius]